MSEARVFSSRDRRLVLEQLPHDRLTERTTGLELDMADRCATASQFDAIIRIPSA